MLDGAALGFVEQLEGIETVQDSGGGKHPRTV
jgi:hypothetical protein